MKFAAAAMLGGLMLLAGPALAQDKKDNDMSNMPGMKSDAMADHHAVRHARYKRNYKTDKEEEQETATLNAQYRGVDKSDIH